MGKYLLILLACILLIACEDDTGPKYTVPLPTFSPSAGTYMTPQSVRISCPIGNVEIRYTTDGTEPNAGTAVYTTPIQVSGTITIKAKGYKSKMKPSAVATGIFSFNVGAIYFQPMGGVFSTPQTVKLLPSTTGTVIHYTTNGSEPNETTAVYTDSLIIDGNTTLKVKGYINGWTPSVTDSSVYQFNCAQLTFSHVEQTYYNDLNLVLSTPTPGASIRYTTDGIEPTVSSQLYTTPIPITVSTMVKAKAMKNNWNPSSTSTANYVLKVVAPLFSPLPNTFAAPQKVTISTTTSGAEVYYTIDGSVPTINSTPYTIPLQLSVNTPLKAVAFKNGWSSSNITSGSFNFYVASPVLDPPEGTYNSTQTITMTCTTPDAEIRYTTNNSEPVSTSILYTAPFELLGTARVQAKGFKAGMTPSLTTSALYQIVNIVALPEFDPPAGIYFEPQDVTITCATTGADIRYTTDGSDPISTSPIYTTPISVTTDMTIKARGYKAGWTTSGIASALYQMDSYNQIVAWGLNNYNQLNVPQGTDFAQIDAGMYHSVGLKTDGSLVAWGRNNNEQCNYPPGNDYVAVSAGDNHCLALKSDGTVVAWGSNAAHQCDVPDSLGYTFIAISAGASHSLALTADSTLVAWGSNTAGQCDVPNGNTFIKISAGANHNIALRANHTLVAWGNNDNGQINAPSGNNYVDIAAGDQHCIARRSTGALVAWGSNSNGQTLVPAITDFTQFSAGYRHNIGLRQDGSMYLWGYNGNDLNNVPTLNSFIAVSAGRDFCIALKAPATRKAKQLIIKKK